MMDEAGWRSDKSTQFYYSLSCNIFCGAASTQIIFFTEIMRKKFTDTTIIIHIISVSLPERGYVFIYFQLLYLITDS